ncbi:hypothetical protein D9V84_05795 [Bacteroidetes/Chlorobi group bacterium Naka2016]|jgi:hypothetical protein|nr:MAG: hypothetical protein D9V84_05795 [Bacteroidetes/Chlorobi group bacterium Naka2016]
MRSLTLKLLLLCFILVSCSKKETSNEQISSNFDTTNKKNELFSFGVDTVSQLSPSKPFTSEQLARIFPIKILDFKLDKVNKGTINYSGNVINSASAEYHSPNGLIVVYVYDYTKFENLPYHLRSIFELSPKDEIFSFENGFGRFSSDNLSPAQGLDYIYLKRFHIKIEGVNFPNFNESALDILNHLNLSLLSKVQGKINNGKF